jgi:hypothetical protein
LSAEGCPRNGREECVAEVARLKRSTSPCFLLEWADGAACIQEVAIDVKDPRFCDDMRLFMKQEDTSPSIDPEKPRLLEEHRSGCVQALGHQTDQRPSK